MKRFIKFFSVVILLIIFTMPANAGEKNSAAEINRSCIASLLKGLSSDNIGLKSSCAYMLGRLKIKEAVIPLMRVLRNDKSEEVRISSLLALYKINTPMSINAVKQAIRFDDSKRVNKLAQHFYTDIQIKRQNDSKNSVDSLFAHRP